MKNRSKINSLTCVAIGAFAIISSGSAFAQISKEAMDVISIPDKVETAIGQLEFFDGVPNDATIDKLYDNLDRMRGVEVYLNHSGAGSLNAMRKGNASIGADASNKVTITEQLLKPASLYLTGNTSTLYALTYLDLKSDGPLVVELPPGMLGFLDDAWFKFIGNLGVIGPDKGKGGKYLLLPPGYSGDVPDGYFIVKPPPTATGCFCAAPSPRVWNRRSRISNRTSRSTHWPRPTIRPRPNSSTHPARATARSSPNDFSFFEELNAVVQYEPIDAIGPETRGLFASVGIVKGKPFKPDARMKKLLTEAAPSATPPPAPSPSPP